LVRDLVCEVDQKQLLGLNFAGSGLGKHSKKLRPLIISSTVKASNVKFGTQLFGLGSSLRKQLLAEPNVAGVWATGTSKNLGPLLLISVALKMPDLGSTLIRMRMWI